MLEYDQSLLQHALFERGFVIDLAEIKVKDGARLSYVVPFAVVGCFIVGGYRMCSYFHSM
jgi:hypothetical protein